MQNHESLRYCLCLGYTSSKPLFLFHSFFSFTGIWPFGLSFSNRTHLTRLPEYQCHIHQSERRVTCTKGNIHRARSGNVWFGSIGYDLLARSCLRFLTFSSFFVSDKYIYIYSVYSFVVELCQQSIGIAYIYKVWFSAYSSRLCSAQDLLAMSTWPLEMPSLKEKNVCHSIDWSSSFFFQNTNSFGSGSFLKPTIYQCRLSRSIPTGLGGGWDKCLNRESLVIWTDRKAMAFLRCPVGL